VEHAGAIAYIASAFVGSLQPMARRPPAHLLQVIAQLGSDDLLMFSTDYPTATFPTPRPRRRYRRALTNLRRKILSENARAFYKL